MPIEEILKAIDELPDSQLYVNRDLDPLAVFDAWMTTGDIKALAAAYSDSK